jgi:hypothetical protein
MAIIRFTKVTNWGYAHIVSTSDDASWGCFIYNNSVDQTLNYPSQDESLPVQMAELRANTNPEKGITLSWETASELNSAGFHVWKSEQQDGEYSRITTAIIPSAGNSSSMNEYAYSDPTVKAGTIYWYKIEEISLDGKSEFHGPISVLGVDPLPKTFAITQNYPNPFNPVTAFGYDLPEASDVSIRVYTLLGKEVKTLVNLRKNAGRYQLTWDGTDAQGRKVASGVYFLAMKAGNFTSVRKMTFLR